MNDARTTGQKTAWRLMEIAKDLCYLRTEVPGLFDAAQKAVEGWCLGEGMDEDPDLLWHVLASGLHTDRLAKALTDPQDRLAPALARAAQVFPSLDRAAPLDKPLVVLPHAALAALEALGYPLLDKFAAHKQLDELCLVLETPYALDAWRSKHPRSHPAFSYWGSEKRFEIPRAPEHPWAPQRPFASALSAPGRALVQEALDRIVRQDKVPANVDIHALLRHQPTVFMDTRLWAALVALGADTVILDATKPGFAAHQKQQEESMAWIWRKGASAHAELARQHTRQERLRHAWTVDAILALPTSHVDIDTVFPMPQEVSA